jgi:hypothetical protein
MTYVRKDSGKAMIQRIVADMAARGMEPDAKETELLGVAAGLADQLVLLNKDVRRNGTSAKLESGRIVMNPAVAAITKTSAELAKVLGQIKMDLGQPVNRVKQKAAQARWAAHNEAKARREAT